MILETHGFARSLLETPGKLYLLALGAHLVGWEGMPSPSSDTISPHGLPSGSTAFCRDSVSILTLPQLSSGPSPPFDLSALLQKELFIAKMMQNL